MGETSKEEMKDNKGADLLRDGYLWRVEDDLLERYEDIGRALIAEIEIYRLSWLVLIIENVSVFFPQVDPSILFWDILKHNKKIGIYLQIYLWVTEVLYIGFKVYWLYQYMYKIISTFFWLRLWMILLHPFFLSLSQFFFFFFASGT